MGNERWRQTRTDRASHSLKGSLALRKTQEGSKDGLQDSHAKLKAQHGTPGKTGAMEGAADAIEKTTKNKQITKKQERGKNSSTKGTRGKLKIIA